MVMTVLCFFKCIQVYGQVHEQMVRHLQWLHEGPNYELKIPEDAMSSVKEDQGSLAQEMCMEVA